MDIATHNILVVHKREEIDDDRRDQFIEAGRSIDKCVSNSGSDESSISNRRGKEVLEFGQELVGSGSGEFANTGRFDISNTVLADIGICRFRILSEKRGPGMIRQRFELGGRRVENDLLVSSHPYRRHR